MVTRSTASCSRTCSNGRHAAPRRAPARHSRFDRAATAEPPPKRATAETFAKAAARINDLRVEAGDVGGKPAENSGNRGKHEGDDAPVISGDFPEGMEVVTRVTRRRAKLGSSG